MPDKKLKVGDLCAYLDDKGLTTFYGYYYGMRAKRYMCSPHSPPVVALNCVFVGDYPSCRPLNIEELETIEAI